MARAKNEFTELTKLQPEAIGEPGKRTFRILADSGSSSAQMWLEKEQLFQLGLAIQQLITTMESEEQTPIDPSPPDREAPPLTRLDFKISKLVLGHDGNRDLYIIDAHDVEENDEETPTVRVWASQQQVSEFAETAIRVCASGRPLCPLCGRAIDPDGHPCEFYRSPRSENARDEIPKNPLSQFGRGLG